MTALLTPSKDIKIANVSSGKVLRVDRLADEILVGQSWSKDHEDIDQRWRLIPVCTAKHQYHIQSVDSDMVLAVSQNSDQKGARVILQKSMDGPHKRWRLIPVGDAEYVITNVGSGMALDVWQASTDDNAPIAQYDYWHGLQQRWKLTTPYTTVRTRAVFTMVRNEHVFLPIWLRYYRRFFRAEDTYVLDHQCTDGSTARDGFVRVPVSRDIFGTGWQRDFIQRYQHKLIDQYDVVLYTDVDEIVAPDPRYCDLGVYIDRFDQDFTTCKGYEVLHMREDEPAFDDTKPVLRQRSVWYHNPLYSKSLLARVPMLWHGGFHERFDRRRNNDPNLYLIHLHRMDYDICFARHQERYRFPRAELDVRKRWGYQNGIIDSAEFAHWFYHDSCGGGPIRPQTIPPCWQDIV